MRRSVLFSLLAVAFMLGYHFNGLLNFARNLFGISYMATLGLAFLVEGGLLALVGVTLYSESRRKLLGGSRTRDD